MQGHRQLMSALGEVGSHDAVPQQVLPHQPPPAVLAKVKVLEHLQPPCILTMMPK